MIIRYMTDFLITRLEGRKSKPLLTAGYPSNFRYNACENIMYARKTPSMGSMNMWLNVRLQVCICCLWGCVYPSSWALIGELKGGLPIQSPFLSVIEAKVFSSHVPATQRPCIAGHDYNDHQCCLERLSSFEHKSRRKENKAGGKNRGAGFWFRVSCF